MKRILIYILLLLSLIAKGQKVSISQNILSSTDSEILSVKDFWNAYIIDISISNDSSKKYVFSKYWNQTELNLGFTDIINDEIPVYTLGEVVIMSIEKIPDGFYKIRNKVLVPGNDGYLVFAIFNTYAKKEESGYKLYNHFFFSKSNLQHISFGDINFYYPKNFSINIDKAKETADSYSKFSALYANSKRKPITYIIGNSFNEANQFIGFDSSIVSSNSKNAGYYIKNQNIILTCREDHVHEIVHSIFDSVFPNSPALFKEGIATYYGGTGGKSYFIIVKQLKELIKNNPNFDLSNFDDLNKTLDDGTNYFYTIGAIFIDYALQTGGSKKVLSLFQYSETNANRDDPMPAIFNILDIEKRQIDTFLKRFILSKID